MLKNITIIYIYNTYTYIYIYISIYIYIYIYIYKMKVWMVISCIIHISWKDKFNEAIKICFTIGNTFKFVNIQKLTLKEISDETNWTSLFDIAVKMLKKSNFTQKASSDVNLNCCNWEATLKTVILFKFSQYFF